MLELIRRIGFVPRHCAWELTLACDLRCRHCGSRAGTVRADELTLEECLDVADQLGALGCYRLSLSGGEPTLHRHWDRIGERLRRAGVRVNMVSNAWGFAEGDARRALDAGLDSVAFSLDGLEAAHDTIRRAGSYGRVLRAVELSLAAGLPVSLITQLNQLNVRQLGDLLPLITGLGVFSWQLQLAVATGTMAEHKELQLAPADLVWLLPELASLRASSSGPALRIADTLGYYGPCEQALRDDGSPLPFWVGCRAGCRVIGIESNGDVKGCLSLPSFGGGRELFVEGNLRQERLEQIWTRPGAFARNRDFKEEQLRGFCAGCRYRDICRGGCTWLTYSHSGALGDNPWCFHQQAVRHGRFDLVEGGQPTAEERAALR